MPVRYEINHELRRVFVTGTGPITDDELVGSDTSFRDAPDVDPSYSQLMDFSSADFDALTRRAIEQITSQPAVFAKQARRAIVVSSNVGYGIARMFELMRNDEAGEVRVFYERAKAEKWLKQS